MSFQDRQYNSCDNDGYGGDRYKITYGLPGITPIVKYLLIVNFVVFVIQAFSRHRIDGYFAVISGKEHAIEVWRLITFQFLHGDPWHLLFNMVSLYFCGTALERVWGSKKLLTFYLSCGLVGGLLFVLVTCLGMFPKSNLVGASGGILGLLVGYAILFPHVQVFLFFPVPIRLLCVVLTVVYILSFIGGEGNAGGDLCHLGGMATGFLWVMGRPLMDKYFAGSSSQKSDFEVKQQTQKQEQVNLEYEVDRILAKVHAQGMHSLTNREKQILRQATENQRKNSR